MRLRAACLAVTVASVLWGFQALFLKHAPGVFNAPEEDMSFAWYVPLFSLYVLWTERRKIVESLGASAFGGLLASIPFLLLGFLGARGLQVRFEILAFAGLCVTVPWLFFGRATAKRFLFPAAFLLFCIPLATYLDVVTVHLRLLASSTAYAVLRGVGADVIREGSVIGATNGSFAIDVAEPCSGLRSIFALMALTAGYAYFNQPTWLRRGLLFATAVPIAIFGNVMRILTICLVAQYGSKDFATGFYHDYSGYVVFVVAILLMVTVGEVISKCAQGVRPAEGAGASDSEKAGAQPAAERRADAGGRLVPLLGCAVIAAAMVYQARTPEVTVAEAPSVRLGEIAGYEATVVPVSEAEKTVLPADTVIEKRLYRAEKSAEWFLASVVFGGTSKSSIHRPELCLPSQGFQMTDPRTVEVDGIEWRFITMDGHGVRNAGFAYTFFNQEGYRTASHMKRIFRDIVDRSFLNRIDRWVMVTVNVSRGDDASITSAIRALKGVVK